MERLLAKYLPLRAPGGDGGGGSDGGVDGGGGGDFKYPDGYPDQFKGGSIEESIGKLFGGFTETNRRAEGLRTQLAQIPKAPDKEDAYVYDPSEKLKPLFGDMAKNPIFAQARKAALAAKMTPEQFSGFIEGVYGPLAEQGLLAAPFDPASELKTFGESHNLAGRELQEALSQADGFANGLYGQLEAKVPEKLRADVKAALVGLTDTAAGNTLLRVLSGRLAENGIRIAGDSQAAGELTAEDLKKLDADPRIDPRNREHPDPAKRFDAALRQRYDDAYKRLAPAQKTGW